jgi:hypothetical protein
MAIEEGDTVLYKGIQRTVEEYDPSDDTLIMSGIDGWYSTDDVIKIPGSDDEEEDDEEEKDDLMSFLEIT